MEEVKILLIEADEIAYRCAAACEKTGYIYHSSIGTSKKLNPRLTHSKIVKYRALKGKRLDVDYTLERYKILDEEHVVAKTLDNMLEGIMRDAIEIGFVNIEEFVLYLSSKTRNNFRYGVANIPGPSGIGYKEGRGERPHHLNLVKERMRKHYQTIDTEGYEADDGLGMDQTHTTLAVHQDKDIDMVEGWHYNPITKMAYFIPWNSLGKIYLRPDKKLRGEGRLWFYAQMLLGDRTDNIPGIPKIGDVTANKLLEGIEDEDEAFNIIQEKYEAYYKDNAAEALAEVADLLWIVRADALTGRQYLKKRRYL